MHLPIKRIAAHCIIYHGETHRLSVAEFDTTTKELTIRPLTHEIHSTRFVSGTVRIDIKDGDMTVEAEQ